MIPPNSEFILTLSCPDRIGIVHAVTGFLLDRACNITDSAQFDDRATATFFMRVSFVATTRPVTRDSLAEEFGPIAGSFAMTWALTDRSVPLRVVLMVSKFDHCLRDLLYRQSIGELAMDVVAVVSNHETACTLAAQHGVRFLHYPVAAGAKFKQEERLLNFVRSERVDVIVLARYMQIFSDALCRALPCPTINIHHSFLPSFKGAAPYQQSHKRGVKLIGATAHYVTADLDEGPIIEQDVERVNHTMTVEDLIAVGRDIEKVVLARAVKLHLERRVLINNSKTVVFR